MCGQSHPRGIVSIRAPVRRPERLSFSPPASNASLFQSALRSEDRSDPKVDWCHHQSSCFNPRSGPKTGATTCPALSRNVLVCFNPRSGPKTGATQTPPNRIPRRCCFNPRSGPKTGATNGHVRHTVGVLRFNPRSGPKTGATRKRRVRGHGGIVSIRAPVRRPERHADA